MCFAQRCSTHADAFTVPPVSPTNPSQLRAVEKFSDVSRVFCIGSLIVLGILQVSCLSINNDSFLFSSVVSFQRYRFIQVGLENPQALKHATIKLFQWALGNLVLESYCLNPENPLERVTLEGFATNGNLSERASALQDACPAEGQELSGVNGRRDCQGRYSVCLGFPCRSSGCTCRSSHRNGRSSFPESQTWSIEPTAIMSIICSGDTTSIPGLPSTGPGPLFLGGHFRRRSHDSGPLSATRGLV